MQKQLRLQNLAKFIFQFVDWREAEASEKFSEHRMMIDYLTTGRMKATTECVLEDEEEGA